MTRLFLAHVTQTEMFCSNAQPQSIILWNVTNSLNFNKIMLESPLSTLTLWPFQFDEK